LFAHKLHFRLAIPFLYSRHRSNDKQPTDAIAERRIDVPVSGIFCGCSKSDNIPWTNGSTRG